MKERDYWDDLGADVRITLDCVLNRMGVEWSHMAGEKNEWPAIVNRVINLEVL
jgi:hypothetical protein